MKKTLSLILVLALMLTALVACGQKTASPAASAAPAEFKTFADILAQQDATNMQYSLGEGMLVYAFELNGVYYRASTAVDEATENAGFDLDYDDPEHDAKWAALIGPLAIENLENLSETIPSQAELDALVGKTGQELLDDGWTMWGGDCESLEFYLNHGAFTYTVQFEGEPANSDTFDWDEGIAPYTVKSATFSGLGDATELD